jgi:hypothetical protein
MGYGEYMISRVQFMGVKRIGRMVSGDFAPRRMRELKSADLEPPSGKTAAGEPLRDMRHLDSDMRASGMRHPLSMGFGKPKAPGMPYLDDGHHRYVAARNAGMEKIPVSLDAPGMPREELLSRTAEFAGGYTRPGERSLSGRVAG